MTERTQWDDTVDEAIELLIDEETDSFTLATTTENDELHLVKATEDVDEMLLAIFAMVEEIRQLSVEAGRELSPDEILTAAAQVAEEYGYLDPNAQFRGHVPGAE